MANCYLMAELLYGAGLLTAITAAPDILISLRLNDKLVSSVSFRYPGVGGYVILSLLATALAVLPKAMTQTNFFKRHPRLALMPWVLVCCSQFLLNFSKYMFAIYQVKRFNNPSTTIMALVMYCIIFSQAIELMLHWFANIHLRIDGIQIA